MGPMQTAEVPDADDVAAVVDVLVDNHRTFLRYLERKTGDRGVAEDILQDAFAKVVAQPERLPDTDALVPWFYRTLRNAAVDRFRRREVRERALASFAHELDTHTEPSAELQNEICGCASRLAATLKPEYAAVLQAVDVGGQSVKAFAEANGLSVSNAGVRVFRARDALRKRLQQSCGTCAEHGCLNCSCSAPRH